MKLMQKIHFDKEIIVIKMTFLKLYKLDRIYYNFHYVKTMWFSKIINFDVFEDEQLTQQKEINTKHAAV